jgi:hypothetical protein
LERPGERGRSVLLSSALPIPAMTNDDHDSNSR